MMKYFSVVWVCLAVAACSVQKTDPAAEEWIRLFNGRDLDGWDVKITGSPLNENLNNTFRVEKGILRASYDEYPGFDGEFGHLFYKEKFSYYKLRIEYRFTGNQVQGGPGWARRNSGVMLHSQSAASMDLDQSFPTSIEFQFLGGLGDGERPTGNLCTPGTHVEMKDSLFTPHCINSTSKTFDGDQWVEAEAIVLGDSVIFHLINGDTVLTYQKPQLDDQDVNYSKLYPLIGSRYLSGGYIALQAESHPVEFRKVELLNLEGCTDPKALNYKGYYMKSDNRLCRYKKKN